MAGLPGRIFPLAVVDGENAPLLDALEERARRNDNETQRRLFGALAGAHLILPVAELPPNVVSGQIVHSGTILLRGTTGPSGEKRTAAFTDEEAMLAFGSIAPIVRALGKSVCAMVLELGFDQLWINPFLGDAPARPGGFLTRREMEAIVTGIVPSHEDQHSAELSLGSGDSLRFERATEPIPPPVADALAKAAGKFREIDELSLLLSSVNNGPWHPTVVIRIKKGFLMRLEEVVIRSFIAKLDLHRYEIVLDLLPERAVPAAEVAAKARTIYKRSK